MQIAVIGTGYVGLVSGACFAELGHQVVCVDKNKSKIKELNNLIMPIYEQGLHEMVKANVGYRRLSFTCNLKLALENVDCVFLAVGTPTDEKDGSADLSYIYKAAEEVAENITAPAIIITKSTVPVGTGEAIKNILSKTEIGAACEVVSNPEFLREGVAVKDFLYPDRIVIGAESENAKNIMRKIYQGLIDRGAKIMLTDIKSAELIKYASNAFLATKIAFINEIASLCEAAGANIKDVAKGMGLDSRIGLSYLQPGPGYGGSCFPKDTKALVHMAKTMGKSCSIVKQVIIANDNRKIEAAHKIIRVLTDDIKDKTIAVLGLAFKANTDDTRESPAIVIINELVKKGAAVRVFDPEAMKESKKLFKNNNVVFAKDGYDASKGADCIVIATEWEEFRTLDYKKIKKLVKQAIIVDMRNILHKDELAALGYKYYCL